MLHIKSQWRPDIVPLTLLFYIILNFGKRGLWYGKKNVRTCITPLKEGMVIETQYGAGAKLYFLVDQNTCLV